ncbi:acetyltransferase [Methanosarcina sp. MSH10X1]|uniref:acyltransferase family protein n=1 Tax=Methanosarcina sp. MSH10X1 TaxID=2507075 RepID=UPI000FFB4710|nr:acyltransferase family protein [Methanosarcina sp. MSH10X1]RXA19860.1 acetyltransferase [Methanosarcina sp. MSH10X1]
MRFHWIDALKGIGIILVVFAHHKLPVALDTYIFSFHMPLFFFISGFLFDFWKHTASAASFVKKRFRSLIVPYFGFALLTCLFYLLLDIGYQPGVTNIDFFKASPAENIHSIVYALGPLISYNPPLWFLTCLFVTELLFYGFAKKYYAEPGKLMFWLTAVGVIGYLYSVYVPFRLPWNADVALTAVVFYGAGNLFRKFIEPEAWKAGEKPRDNPDYQPGLKFRRSLLRVWKFLPGILTLVNLLYFGYLLHFPTPEEMNMNVLKYGNFFSYYLLAFSGIFTFVYLFKNVRSSKVLEYYGRNSLIVLALHFPVKDILTKLIVLVFMIDVETYYYNAGFALGLTVLNLFCMIPVIFLINTYFPYLLGIKRPSESSESLRTRLKKFIN